MASDKVKPTSYRELEINVIRWAEERKIIPRATPAGQLLKMVSEVGELCDAEGKKNIPEVKDAVGDVMVCLINYCALKDIDVVQCLGLAFDQIKDRTGTLMADGTFVKDEK